MGEYGYYIYIKYLGEIQYTNIVLPNDKDTIVEFIVDYYWHDYDIIPSEFAEFIENGVCDIIYKSSMSSSFKLFNYVGHSDSLFVNDEIYFEKVGLKYIK